MIIGTRGEIIVFEKNPKQKILFREARRLKGFIDDINCCAFSADNKYIITGGEDRTVRIWDFKVGGEKHTDEVWGVPVPERDPVLSDSEEGLVGLWKKG